jgi:hypothetical protein
MGDTPLLFDMTPPLSNPSVLRARNAWCICNLCPFHLGLDLMTSVTCVVVRTNQSNPFVETKPRDIPK